MGIYTVRADVEAEFDASHLSKYLSEDGTGTETAGLFNKLSDAVDHEILGSIATLPPEIVLALASYLRYVAKVLFCSMAYRRRGVADDANPWAKLAEGVRERLKEIQAGDLNFRQLKTLSYLVPARSFNKFSSASDRIENFSSATPSFSAPSGELVLTASDGTQWKMVVSYSGGQVVHSWEEVE